MLLAAQALAALRRRQAAQVAVVWQAVREAFEEKTEAIGAQSIEVLTHLLAALA